MAKDQESSAGGRALAGARRVWAGVRTEERALLGLWALCVLVALSSRTGFDFGGVFKGYWGFFAKRVLYLFVFTRVLFYLGDRWQPKSPWATKTKRFFYGDPDKQVSTEHADLEIVRGTMLLFASLTIYTNIKNRIPFINETRGDEFYAKMDGALGLNGLVDGIEGWFRGSHSVVEFFESIYLHGYFFMMLLVFILYLRRDAFGIRWTIISVCFTYLLGILMTTAYPSYGPCFVDPESFWFLHNEKIGVTQAWLAATHDFNATMVSVGFSVEPRAFTGIAAFPSLHIGHMFVMMAVAWHLVRPYTIIMVGMAGVTFIATIGFGWHYAVDAPGGALLAVGVTFLLLRLMTKWDAQRLARSDAS